MREREGLRAQGYDAIGRSGSSDPMRQTDARIDAEGRARAELAECESLVADARAVCRGVRIANPTHPQWGDVLELRYVEAMDWDSTGRALGVTGSGARQAARAALDWIDSVGLARAREGMGQAVLS